MPLLSLIGDNGLIWIVWAACLLASKKTRRWGVVMLAALLAGFLIGNVAMKPLIGRVRPYEWRPEVIMLTPPLADASFPSGHTLSSFAAAVSLFLHHRRWGAAALTLAALIAFSRLYLYVHFPTDVLAGAFLGVLCAFAARAWVGYVWRAADGPIPPTRAPKDGAEPPR